MPTKEEVKKAYKNIKLTLKALEDDQNISRMEKTSVDR